MDWSDNMKRFWTAEEVPRWFGLSLVLLYLGGLGAVWFVTLREVGGEAEERQQACTAYALRLLSSHLSSELRHVPSYEDACRPAHYQRFLREFASETTPAFLRVVTADRRIIASTSDAEVGRTAPPRIAGDSMANGLETATVDSPKDGRPLHFLRAVVRMPRLGAAGTTQPASGHAGETSAASPAPDRPAEVPGVASALGSLLRTTLSGDDREAGDDTHPSGQPNALDGPGHQAEPTAQPLAASPVGPRHFYLEAAFPADEIVSPLDSTAGMLGVVLVVGGALFALIRSLRGQMRSAAQIAERLRGSADSIEEDLASLRIVDACDSVALAWNSLIELTEELRDDAGRQEAYAELSKAIQQSSGGALASALHALQDGLIHIGSEGQFDYVNAAACRWLGCTPEEATQQTLRTSSPTTELGRQLVQHVREAEREGAGFDATSAVIELPEQEGAYRIWITPLGSVRHEGECVVMTRDISQQLRAERVREEFVTQVTHELRTPLTNIRAYAETLSSGMFEDPKVITECYNVITKETRRLSRLIEDMLSVSQMEVGSIELQVDDVDLKSLLSDAVRDVRNLADEKGIDLQLVLPAKLGSMQGDKDKLNVVLNNLLGNAIKYTADNGAVQIGCQTSEDTLSITVKDNGLGIGPADQARVFEKFQRAEDPDVQNETGSGIGLYTAREIVRRHGGDIDLISKKGEGSTFIVKLPHQEGRASALSAG